MQLSKASDRIALAVGGPVPKWAANTYSAIVWALVALVLWIVFAFPAYLSVGEWLRSNTGANILPSIPVITFTAIALGFLRMGYRIAAFRRSEILSGKTD